MSYDGETCSECGFPVSHFVRTWWHAEDSLWLRVVGQFGPILCPPCFTGMAREKGIFLSWHPRVAGVREGVSPL